jgi:AAA family ATP:ADP antiporter
MQAPGIQGTMESGGKSYNIFYRFLRLFTDIRPGEASTALLLTINVFFLMMAYYLIKPIRETLIIVGTDPQTKSYLGGAQAILLIFVIKAFSYLASKVPRHLLISWVTLFFISNLGLFYVFHLLNMPMATMGVIFFIWIGIFNIFVVAQFWGFANDIYIDETGKRLFPLIAFGQTAGPVFGATIASFIIKPLGKDFAYIMMLISAALLGVCILMTILIHKKEIKGIREKAAKAKKEVTAEDKLKEKALRRGGGFRLIFKSQYLLFYAFVILLLNFVNASGEFIWSDTLKRVASNAVKMGTAGGLDTAQLVAKISAGYQGLASIIALVLQLFIVSRIIKWIGVAGSLFILPFIALGGYGAITLGALSLVFIKWIKGMENGTDYSVMNTAKGALFLITSREEKYKGKAAADTFFYRGGDALAALTVFIGVNFLGFSIQSYAKLNVVVILVWILFCVLVIREYKKLKAKQVMAQAGQSS